MRLSDALNPWRRLRELEAAHQRLRDRHAEVRHALLGKVHCDGPSHAIHLARSAVALIRELKNEDPVRARLVNQRRELRELNKAYACIMRSWNDRVAECARLRATKEPPEVVICSAIRLPDGRIFRGHRHGDCLATAIRFVNWNGGVDPWLDTCEAHEQPHVDRPYWLPEMGGDHGFITSRNRYVGRQEGMRLQLAAGIESAAPGGYRGATLFSEDLY